MSKKTIRNLIVVVCLSVFFFTGETMLLWGLLLSIILLGTNSRSIGSRTVYQSYIYQVGADAKRFDAPMPRQHLIRKALVQIYKKREQSIKRYPHLQEEFQKLIDEMWLSLTEDHRPSHWKHVIGEVSRQWPSSQQRENRNLEDQLRKIKELSRQWDEAQVEASSRSSV